MDCPFVLIESDTRIGDSPSCTRNHCNDSTPGVSGASGQRLSGGALASTLAKDNRFRSMHVVSTGSGLELKLFLTSAVRKAEEASSQWPVSMYECERSVVVALRCRALAANTACITCGTDRARDQMSIECASKTRLLYMSGPTTVTK
jgi:hypothetical protein